MTMAVTVILKTAVILQVLLSASVSLVEVEGRLRGTEEALGYRRAHSQSQSERLSERTAETGGVQPVPHTGGLLAESGESASQSKHWAVLVAGSNGYYNYRHQVRLSRYDSYWSFRFPFSAPFFLALLSCLLCSFSFLLRADFSDPLQECSVLC